MTVSADGYYTHRHEIGAARLDGLSHVGSDEKRGVAKSALETGRDVGRRTECQKMDDFVVGEMIAVLDKPVHQGDRLRGA